MHHHVCPLNQTDRCTKHPTQHAIEAFLFSGRENVKAILLSRWRRREGNGGEERSMGEKDRASDIGQDSHFPVKLLLVEPPEPHAQFVCRLDFSLVQCKAKFKTEVPLSTIHVFSARRSLHPEHGKTFRPLRPE
jgi:hypothetical protein